MQELIASIAKQTGVSEQMVVAAASGCAGRLAKWFESEQAAIDAINDDASAMIEIAMADWLKAQRKLAEVYYMNPQAAAAQVLEIIQQRAAH